MPEDFATRSARPEDNLTDIAKIIYATDPYIYPFWFGSEDDAIMSLHALIHSTGTIFSLDNLYVVWEIWSRKILGAIVAISSRSDLSYDYSPLKQTNDHYRFAIERYVEPSVRHAQESDPDTMTILDCCVAPDARRRGLGKLLLNNFMIVAQAHGFRRFELDCLADNQPALALYHGLGFQNVKPGIGFDGTDHSQVAIMSLARHV